jgi:uncharacterized protein (AIM24 family)
MTLVAVSGAREREVEQAVTRGSELLKQGNLEGALQLFRAAHAADATNPRVMALLGVTFFRTNQFAQARPIYEQLVDSAPTDASHRLNLGLVYLKLGETDRAIGALEASRALDPSQGRAVSYLGLAYARAGRFAEAYRAFLLAGQQDLAKEIESNLTAGERDSVHTQLARSGLEPVVTRARAPDAPPETAPSEPVPLAAAARPEPARAPAAAPEAAAPVEIPPARPLDEPESPNFDVVVEASPQAEPPRMTESMQFVLPRVETAAPKPADERSMISRAVDDASAATASAFADDANAPIPLSQLATQDLVRPDDSVHAFETSPNGVLVIRVRDRIMTRLAGVHATGGDLVFERAMRRSRGHLTEEAFAYGGVPLHVVSGHGYLIAAPGDRTFTAVTLDDDIFYLREDLVFAFEASLRWENGNVPGLRGRLPVVQFRGDGSVVLATTKPLVRIKLPAQGVVFVAANKLGGWIGRVIPRAVVPAQGGPMGEVCVECTGEGVVLVDPVGETIEVAMKAESSPRTSPPSHPPPLAELVLDDDARDTI